MKPTVFDQFTKNAIGIVDINSRYMRKRGHSVGPLIIDGSPVRHNGRPLQIERWDDGRYVVVEDRTMENCR